MPRNLPGVRNPDPEEDEPLDGFEGDDEEFDTEDDETEDEQDDDEADDEEEDDLDDATAAIVAKREAAITQRVKAQLRTQGFDLSDDLTPTIRDLATAQKFLGNSAAPAAQAAQQPVQTARAQPEEEKDDPMPDPDIEGQPAFQAWMSRQTQKAIKAAMGPLVQELTATRATVLQRDARDATRTAARLLQSEGFEDAARHPKFTEVFTSFLARIEPDQWGDEDNLLRLGLMCLPDLKGGAPRVNTSKQKERARADASRSLLSQANPSRGTQAGLRPAPTVDPVDAAAAKRLGMSVGEYTSLKDPTGEAYERWKQEDKRKQRAKGGKS